MPLTRNYSDKLYYSAAVFRLEDSCVRLQENMEGFYKTAAIEAVDGIEIVFRWFARRGVTNVLFTELADQDLKHVLNRLGWNADFCQQHRLVVLPYDSSFNNPFEKLVREFNIQSSRQLIVIGDRADFLATGADAGVQFNIAVAYGSSNHQQLATAPVTGILDSIMQLPNFIIENGISQEKEVKVAKPSFLNLTHKVPMRLFLRLPFF